MELDNLLIEEKLSEADQEAEMTIVRYTKEEVFGRAKATLSNLRQSIPAKDE